MFMLRFSHSCGTQGGLKRHDRVCLEQNGGLQSVMSSAEQLGEHIVRSIASSRHPDGLPPGIATGDAAHFASVFRVGSVSHLVADGKRTCHAETLASREMVQKKLEKVRSTRPRLPHTQRAKVDELAKLEREERDLSARVAEYSLPECRLALCRGCGLRIRGINLERPPDLKAAYIACVVVDSAGKIQKKSGSAVYFRMRKFLAERNQLHLLPFCRTVQVRV
jgi:hypothetical protein